MRYFLHCDHGGEWRRDYEGAEFPDTETAIVNATQAAKLIADEGLELGDDRSEWQLVLADEEARELAKIDLKNSARRFVNEESG